jgi:hypothetical protein
MNIYVQLHMQIFVVAVTATGGMTDVQFDFNAILLAFPSTTVYIAEETLGFENHSLYMHWNTIGFDNNLEGSIRNLWRIRKNVERDYRYKYRYCLLQVQLENTGTIFGLLKQRWQCQYGHTTQ